MYLTKTELAKFFGVSRNTVYDRIKGIEDEIERGRYNRYAISDNLVNVAVFVDYNKYRKMLNNKNIRKHVPPFEPLEIEPMLAEDVDEQGKKIRGWHVV